VPNNGILLHFKLLSWFNVENYQGATNNSFSTFTLEVLDLFSELRQAFQTILIPKMVSFYNVRNYMS